MNVIVEFPVYDLTLLTKEVTDSIITFDDTYSSEQIAETLKKVIKDKPLNKINAKETARTVYAKLQAAKNRKKKRLISTEEMFSRVINDNKQEE